MVRRDECGGWRLYTHSRPMYFVQLTIDEHTVDQMRSNEGKKRDLIDLGCSRNVDYITTWSTSIIGGNRANCCSTSRSE